MTLRIFDSLDYASSAHGLPTYFTREYLQTQAHQNLLIAESDHFLTPLNLEKDIATSINKSPFGSFWVKKIYDIEDLHAFNQSLVNSLELKGASKICIQNPSPLYNSFVSKQELLSTGYQVLFEDINQHIALEENWEDSIHAMQKRKLRSLLSEGFVFKVIEDLETAYQFIKVCRQTQGLQVNIEWDHLETLAKRLPTQYECFAVERAGKLSAVCITVRVTEEVAYYYLPATSPLFRSQSPMVLLIAGMVDYYRKKKFKYLDLGVSSLKGRVQEPLKVFKERMGGIVTEKAFLELSL